MIFKKRTTRGFPETTFPLPKRLRFDERGRCDAHSTKATGCQGLCKPPRLQEFGDGGIDPFRLLTEPSALSVFCTFMKVVSSIKSAKKRHPACQVVRRKGKIYVINKVEPRYKARQG